MEINSERIREFINDNAKKVSNKAAETKDYIQKRLNIAKLESEIEDLYIEIGKITYESITGDRKNNTDQISALVNLIIEKNTAVKDIKRSLGITICPNCGKTVDDDDDFCPKCGTPLREFKSEKSKKKSSEIIAEVGEKISDSFEKAKDKASVIGNDIVNKYNETKEKIQNKFETASNETPEDDLSDSEIENFYNDDTDNNDKQDDQ